MLIGDFPNGLLKAGETHNWPYANNRKGEKIDVRKIRSPIEHTEDLLYIRGIKEGKFTLTDTNTSTGFGMTFPKEIFNTVNLWLNYGGWLNYYVIGIEPSTGYPLKLDEAIKTGEYSTLNGYGSLECEINAFVFSEG
jgi:hypothetical protein